MNFGLQNRLCLVTASSKGIGRATAEALATEGARVVLSGREEASLAQAAQDIKATGTLACDLSLPASVTDLSKNFSNKFGSPEILVINMPGPPKGAFQDLAWNDWQKGFETLFSPAVQLIQWAAPAMKAAKFGRIILLTSLSAKEPIARMPISSSLRAGLGNLVKLLARDLASSNITVNAVLPGWTLTPGVQKLNVAETLAPTLPQQRLLLPKEVGDVAAFLCSTQASGLTGQSILVDGASTTSY